MITAGAPKRAIHVLKKAFVTVSARQSAIGIVSDHSDLVVLPIMVRQYLNPLETGRGPTISMWT